ncbi:hypothetical protein L873DRAFT_801258 [Choiromyces venosus 120613-1]|uniref:Uncharacterized protein n=1 Tax=Choiromyces venosus 120613-1 TaxID=1336337 RepID=A0A3N4K4S6_9PEZI|nr:hypothetical protein L873DRAFT_801258 [Choiromyces venosus 120613-1]
MLFAFGLCVSAYIALKSSPSFRASLTGWPSWVLSRSCRRRGLTVAAMKPESRQLAEVFHIYFFHFFFSFFFLFILLALHRDWVCF